jgi:dolichol kinase
MQKNSKTNVEISNSSQSSATNRDDTQISYRQEVFRKMIHCCSLSIPIIYAFIDRQTALILLLCVFTPFFVGDVARHFLPWLDTFVRTSFGSMMRRHELDDKRFSLNGATYVLISALICVAAFPKIIAITAFTILIVSDVSSALIGRKFGTVPFLDKSLQGTSAFWISAWIAVGVIWRLTGAPWEYAAVGIAAGFVGGVAEASSTRLRVDDNFSVPLSVGFALWGLLYLCDTAVREEILRLLV